MKTKKELYLMLYDGKKPTNIIEKIQLFAIRSLGVSPSLMSSYVTERDILPKLEALIGIPMKKKEVDEDG